MGTPTYLAIDLKSFYASAECVARGLDPLDTNLVVADASRTSKTICLAVSPALKSLGIGGRPRLFEVEQRVAQVNEERRLHAPGRRLRGSSASRAQLDADPALAVGYVVAKPRMAHYLDTSARIYSIYLKYASERDIHVYSVDEVFIDATHYLPYFRCSPHELARRIIAEIQRTTGITATAGIGTNLYLAKVAMDIVAKHVPADADGVRIAQLDEAGYRRTLWGHRPLTDFWRVGRSTAHKLEHHGIMTMGDLARCSLGLPNDYYNEELLFRWFGVNAELLIDHAWGREPCTIADIKDYRPQDSSISSGQVLHEPYDHAHARVVALEMADQLAFDLAARRLVTDQVGLGVGYDRSSLEDGRGAAYAGPVKRDRYGRLVPKPAHGTQRLGRRTASASAIRAAVGALYDRLVDPALLVRRFTVSAGAVHGREEPVGYEQPDLFSAADGGSADSARDAQGEREERVQQAILQLKERFGGNAVLTGTNLEEGATGRDRNRQIGGHAA
ncbi:hypothetical protein [Bifidobacterium cuniculi]|uniref:Nucleotidyltransferase/DNA polymerase involved in DNA repair n=1 Tax=Bifidobacterium cuniculi TaxID=1688 RepID=A0A087AT46_9BIFI|nr:hypothetical protein [Bifidobacterium cuniculi]KFI61946.1 Nucleotidyltransferase/DNA polymerase involved in DNA repair [Bifidobacterium cuniculi]